MGGGADRVCSGREGGGGGIWQSQPEGWGAWPSPATAVFSGVRKDTAVVLCRMAKDSWG